MGLARPPRQWRRWPWWRKVLWVIMTSSEEAPSWTYIASFDPDALLTACACGFIVALGAYLISWAEGGLILS